MQRIAAALAVTLLTLSATAQEPLWLEGPFSRLPPIDAPSVLSPPPSFPETLPPPAGAPPAAPTAGAATPAEALDPASAWQVWTPAFWNPWDGSVELGLSGTEGNTQTFNVRFGATAKHKTDTLAETLQITSIQKSANGATTANTALIDGRIEWPLPESRWNYFLHGLTEYDQFKAFRYRFSADTGFGYEFIQNDLTTLLTRTGLSMSKEVGGNDGDFKPELTLGGEFKHKFNATHSIIGKVDYFPNVTRFSDFRLNSQAAWQIALSEAWGLSLKLSIIDRYDSTPQGARPNDLDYSTLVLWQF